MRTASCRPCLFRRRLIRAIAMIGYLFEPHGPETGVVKRVYLELARLIDSVGTDKFNETRNQVMRF